MSDDTKKILVVEGNASLGRMIQTDLEKAGYQVGAVENGRDALDQVGNGYDMMVTDYDMTDSLGSRICHGIRQHRRLSKLPMIVICGDRSVDLPTLKAELVLAAVFKKPLSVKELVHAVNQHFTGGGESPAADAPAEAPAAEETPPAEAAPASDSPPAEAAPEPAADAPAADPAEQ